MAEGWTKHLHEKRFEVYSAGTETHGLNPNAVKVMKEAGIDISKQKSEKIDDFIDKKINVVITVCDNANETCPVFPSECRVIHAGFEDPPALARKLAEKGGSEEEQLNCYRKVREKIKKFVEKLPEII